MYAFETVNDRPKNAIKYILKKLKKRMTGKEGMLYPGYSEIGYAKALTDELLNFSKENPEAIKSDYDKPQWEWQKEAKPKIGCPFLIHGGGVSDWVRTSTVKSYYVCDDPENHPDKLVLPKDFPIEDISSIPEMKKGDLLIATRNSIYLLEVLGEKQ